MIGEGRNRIAPTAGDSLAVRGEALEDIKVNDGCAADLTLHLRYTRSRTRAGWSVGGGGSVSKATAKEKAAEASKCKFGMERHLSAYNC